jgi:hypothetical protein
VRQAVFVPAARIVTVLVDRNEHGDWDVALPGGSESVTCETLDDARRIAYLYAAHRHPCELVVRDADHRVLERDFFDGAGPKLACPPGRRR